MVSNYLEKQLKQYFNYSKFRTGQREIIEDILRGNDVLGVLPTGSGKSLCYQLPSILLPHLTVVISPLISLMIDQVRETKAYHFKHVVALHSMLSHQEREDVLNRLDEYKIIYISPELIQQNYIINQLVKRKVSLFVIDEAHCISQWGHDFRPDYLRLTHIVKRLNNPPILALSGTITTDIERDIIKQLVRPEMIIHKYSMERENISLLVHSIGQDETKDEHLIDIVQQHKVPTIIYFSSRKRSEEIARTLSKVVTGRAVAYYHGGLDPESRLKIQQQFLHDQLHVICATSAFGMGINKQNVRLVIHYHLPTQKESFIQEIGRAGRDGEPSVSIVLFAAGDEYVPQQLVENELPTEKDVHKLLNLLYIYYENHKIVPSSATSLMETLQINETKLKLLRYHLETRGIINHNKINYDASIWKKAAEEIIHLIENRKTLKYGNVLKMLAYVYSESCLREELYKDFDTSPHIKRDQCCSLCGFSWDDLADTFKHVEQRQETAQSWQQQLAYLLEIGERS